MISENEIRSWVDRTGTSVEQVRKDHLVSHLMNGLRGRPGVVFYGGTALHRTFVADRRLSEDIDLFRHSAEPTPPEMILDWLAGATKRDFPDLRIESGGTRADVLSYDASVEQLSVRIQIVGPRPEFSRLELGVRPAILRYSDLPQTVDLVTPTLAAFTAMKIAAYEDRRAVRDLFDLGVLEEIGAFDDSALTELRAYRGYGPTRWMYSDDSRPPDRAWRTELQHQTANPGSATEVVERVRRRLGELGGWDQERA